MKRFALLSLCVLAAASAVQGCGAPDVSIAANGDAGKSSQQSAGSSSISKNTGGGSNSSVGGHSGSTASGGTSSGGASTTKSEAGMAGQLVVDSGGAAAAGADGAGGENATSGCTGAPPLCFGNDTSKCCGNDPAGQAVCQGEQWTCFGAAAPGCNGDRCTDLFACGPTLKCHRAKEYCTVLAGGIGGDQYQCTALPTCQDTHSNCECINRPECQVCNQDVNGNVFLSCAVG
jgi:hypothetical protein